MGRQELVFTGEWYSILAMHSIFGNDFPTVFCSTNVHNDLTLILILILTLTLLRIHRRVVFNSGHALNIL